MPSFFPTGYAWFIAPTRWVKSFVEHTGPRFGVLTGGGGNRGGAGHRAKWETCLFGAYVFLVSEAMMFASLALAFVLTRMNFEQWPPPGQPRLPLSLSTLNLMILLASGVGLMRAHRAFARKDLRRYRLFMGVAALLALTFLMIQGWEWLHMMEFGLHPANNLYGASFYILIGFHALHALAAFVLLGSVTLPVVLGGWPRQHFVLRFALARLFWYFVVAVWPPLFVVLYLG